MFGLTFGKQQAGDEGALGSHGTGRDGICWEQVRTGSGFLGRLALAQGYVGLSTTNEQFTGTLTSSQKTKFSPGG